MIDIDNQSRSLLDQFRAPEPEGAERQLSLLNFAMDQVVDCIFLMEDDSPRFAYVNRSAVETLGYTREELTGGMGVFDIDPEWSPQRWADFLPELHRRNRMTIETVHRTRDGRTIPVEVTSSHFEFEGRHHIIAIARDISQRRAAEAALRKSETMYRSVVNAMAEGVCFQNAQGEITTINPAAERIEGRTHADVVGKTSEAPDWDAIREDGSPFPGLEHPSMVTLRTGEPQANVIMGIGRPDGTRRWISINSQPMIPAGEAVPQGVVTTFHDITDRRLAEAAVRAREREYRTLAENTPDFIVRWDREMRRLYVNPAFADSVGSTTRQLVGTAFGTLYRPDLLALNRPSIAQLVERVTSAFASGVPWEGELSWWNLHGMRVFDLRLVPERGADGQIATVLGIGRDITVLKQSERQLRSLTDHSPDVIARFDLQGRYLYANRAIERVTGVPAAAHLGRLLGDVTGVGPDGAPAPSYLTIRRRLLEVAATARPAEIETEVLVRGVLQMFNTRLIPELDDRGAVASVLMVARDVTESRRLEDQLRQAQKMEAVGQLAGGIAHDFNNMLAVIQMQSSLMLLEGADAKVHEGLTQILGATERSANLTRQLLTFSRRHVPQPIDLDVSEVIANMTRLFRRVLGEDITLETRFAPSLPLVHADPGMMEQVLMNLGINARDAMPDGGCLGVALEGCTVDEQRAALRPGKTAGRYVCLSVSDTGTGIRPADLPRIFEPFFTTKEVGKGTGLGLATVFAIVEQHHGWIEVDSTLGRGTTFRVLLPAREGVTLPTARVPAPEVIRGGNETVLLVEDEAAVRMVTRSALERYGYRVLEADSGQRALEVWDAETKAVDLLLTDLIMPGGITGQQLAEQLLARSPGLKIIYISGYSPDVSTRVLGVDLGHTLLQKPISTGALATGVRRCLDG
jgi:two-component system cell cycle sensor histidine kinase/response regulator CckA